MRTFRALVIIARLIYWISGFAILGGIIVFFLTAGWTPVLVLIGGGAALWVVAQILARLAYFRYLRLPEDEQSIVDPERALKPRDSYFNW